MLNDINKKNGRANSGNGNGRVYLDMDKKDIQKDSLYLALKSAGADEGHSSEAVLKQHFINSGIAKLATKEDLTALTQMFSNEIALVRSDVTKEISLFRSEVTNDFTLFRGEVTNDFTLFRGEVAKAFTLFRGEVTKDLSLFRGEVTNEFTLVRSEMTSGFAAMESRFDSMEELNKSENKAFREEMKKENAQTLVKMQEMLDKRMKWLNGLYITISVSLLGMLATLIYLVW